MAYAIPPDEVFSLPPKPLEETQGAYTIPDFVNLSYSEKEGMVANYFHRPFPRKGLIYPEAIELNNIVKKIIVLIIRSIMHPSKFLLEFAWTCDYIFRPRFIGNGEDKVPIGYLEEKFYCNTCRELWKLIRLFFIKFGTNEDLANRLGKIVAHVFQYEENYRFWLQDLFGQVSQKDLLDNTRRSLKLMTNVFSRRIKVGVDYKIKALTKLLSIALYIPKVRRAWKFAFEQIDITNLRLDKADRWWMLSSGDYDLEDRNIEDRFAEHVDIYNWHQVKLLKENIINQQKNAT